MDRNSLIKILVKRAEETAATPGAPPQPPVVGPPTAKPADIHGDALQKLLYIALAGGGAGLAFGGLNNLMASFRRPKGMGVSAHTEPTVIDIPFPRRRKPEKEKRASDPVFDTLFNPKAKSIWEVPAFYPAALLAGTGGVAAGNELAKWIAEKRRNTILDSDLNASKKRYHKALLSQYMNSVSKNAAAKDHSHIEELEGPAKEAAYAEAISKELDGLYEEASSSFKAQNEKTARFSWSEVWPRALGGYLGLASVLGLGSGVLAYNMTDKRDPKKILDEAIKAKQEEANSRRPQEIFIRPVPVDVEPGKERRQMARAMKKVKLPGAD